MSDEKEIRQTLREEQRPEKMGKYKPLPRNRQTENDLFKNIRTRD
jgi:hypothetical protein